MIGENCMIIFIISTFDLCMVLSKAQKLLHLIVRMIKTGKYDERVM
jgi:hypothetical protein